MVKLTQEILENNKTDQETLESVMFSDAAEITTREGVKLKPVKKLISEGEDQVLNLLQYNTKSAMDSAGGSNGRIACVTNDSTTINNGFYQRTSDSWVKVILNEIHEELNNSSLTSSCLVKNNNILNSIDPFKRINVVPTADFYPIAEEPIDDAWTFTRSSAATRINRFGIIEELSSNEIRHDYNPETGEYLGVLFEGTRTNIMQQSEDSSWSGYTQDGIDVELNASKAPDGSNTANKWIENSSSSNHRIYESLSITTNENYIASVFVKPIDRYGFTINAYNASGDAQDAQFDLLNGDVTTDDSFLGDAFIQKFPNGWFRVGISFNNSSDTGTTLTFGMAKEDGTTGYTSEEKSLLVWGFQVEDSNSVTSYIKTEGSQVTRNKDLLELFFTDYDFYQDWNDATIYCEFMTNHVSDNNQQKPFRISDGTGSQDEFTFIVNASIIASRLREGSSTTSYQQTDVLKDEFVKVAAVKKSGEQALFLNGIKDDDVDSASSVSPPMDRLEINATETGVNQNWIKRASYLPFALNDLQLKKLTG